MTAIPWSKRGVTEAEIPCPVCVLVHRCMLYEEALQLKRTYPFSKDPSFNPSNCCIRHCGRVFHHCRRCSTTFEIVGNFGLRSAQILTTRGMVQL